MPSTNTHRTSGPGTLGAGVLAVLLLASLPAVAGEVYQWKDANGVTHYSDAPPPTGEYSNRTIEQRTASADVAAAQAEAPPEDTACTDARSNLELLRSDQPIGLDSDGDGEPDSTLTPEQRTAQTTLAEAAIGVHCASTPDVDPDSDGNAAAT